MATENKYRDMPPRLITFPELKTVMGRYVHGWSWADDALWDLWKLGAPAPQDKCPGERPCPDYPACTHIRRILLPTHFEKWYNEVRQRMGYEMEFKQAYRRK